MADLSKNSAGTVMSGAGHIKDGTLIYFKSSSGYVASSVTQLTELPQLFSNQRQEYL
ncbi:hypothetical protein [Methanobacterium sp. SMA-27]|uniref:hypothetical protein n=1 Tax=Methanobacterium sp. SMA-27 TaxID=1495336 RepID=UPI0012E033FB|nr:hypothetical protein [Methanobacterium sp. SMA-27]